MNPTVFAIPFCLHIKHPHSKVPYIYMYIYICIYIYVYIYMYIFVNPLYPPWFLDGVSYEWVKEL